MPFNEGHLIVQTLTERVVFALGCAAALAVAAIRTAFGRKTSPADE